MLMDTTHGQDALEADLLAASAAGNQSAFERLYRLYEKRVYQYVYSLVYDATLAEDIVGESMMAVWRGAGAFAGTSRVSTWIFGIARHKALDALRQAGRRQREVDLDGAADLPHPQDSPITGVHRQETAALIQRALAQLSRDHQEVLRLVFYEELPYEEIATLLAIPVNTVKTRVYYAKQQLKEQWERLGQKESPR
jgi:RNA polymerase sigma-70 factor (ECF subfamily)